MHPSKYCQIRGLKHNYLIKDSILLNHNGLLNVKHFRDVWEWVSWKVQFQLQHFIKFLKYVEKFNFPITYSIIFSSNLWWKQSVKDWALTLEKFIIFNANFFTLMSFHRFNQLKYNCVFFLFRKVIRSVGSWVWNKTGRSQ